MAPRTVLTMLVSCFLVLSCGESGLQEGEGAQGKVLFTTYCGGCHGGGGEGDSFRAGTMGERPRDLTDGTFKFRSTPSGTLPTDEDLYRTVSHGVFRALMPQFTRLTEQQRRALVDYVKTLSPRWEAEGAGEPTPYCAPPPFLGEEASLARGAYNMLECAKCHGVDGRGDGPSAAMLGKDNWDEAQDPCDFTRGLYKSGATAEDLRRALVTGLDGTSMASFGEVLLNPDGMNIRQGDGWHLAAYVRSLSGRQGQTVDGRRERPRGRSEK